jgi:hypothetical protein
MTIRQQNRTEQVFLFIIWIVVSPIMLTTLNIISIDFNIHVEMYSAHYNERQEMALNQKFINSTDVQ